MARVTIEDCLKQIDGHFNLVKVAGARARQLATGHKEKIDNESDKGVVVALREIAAELVDEGVLTEVQEEKLRAASQLDVTPQDIGREVADVDDHADSDMQAHDSVEELPEDEEPATTGATDAAAPSAEPMSGEVVDASASADEEVPAEEKATEERSALDFHQDAPSGEEAPEGLSAGDEDDTANVAGKPDEPQEPQV